METVSKISALDTKETSTPSTPPSSKPRASLRAQLTQSPYEASSIHRKVMRSMTPSDRRSSALETSLRGVSYSFVLKSPTLVPLPFLPSAIQDPGVSKAKKKGNKAFAAGEWKVAFAAYDKAISRDTQMKYPKIWYRRGLCLEKMGAYNQALSDFATAFNLAETNIYGEAIERVMNIIHKAALPHYMLGEAAFVKEDWKLAVSHFTRAILADPTFPHAFLKRALCYEKLGQFEAGIEDSVKANYRYFVRRKRRETAEITTRLQDAFWPEASKLKKKGDIEFDNKKWDQAILLYTESIDAGNKYPDSWYNRGLAYEKQGNLPRALEDLVHAHKLLRRPDALERCVDAIERIYATMHKAAVGSKKDGDKHFQVKEWEKAEACYTRAITRDPRYPHAYFLRGVCREYQDDLDGAREDYIKARELYKREDCLENCRAALRRIKRLQEGKESLSSPTVQSGFVDALDAAQRRSESAQPFSTYLYLTEQEEESSEVKEKTFLARQRGLTWSLHKRDGSNGGDSRSQSKRSSTSEKSDTKSGTHSKRSSTSEASSFMDEEDLKDSPLEARDVPALESGKSSEDEAHVPSLITLTVTDTDSTLPLPTGRLSILKKTDSDVSAKEEDSPVTFDFGVVEKERREAGEALVVGETSSAGNSTTTSPVRAEESGAAAAATDLDKSKLLQRVKTKGWNLPRLSLRAKGPGTNPDLAGDFSPIMSGKVKSEPQSPVDSVRF